MLMIPKNATTVLLLCLIFAECVRSRRNRPGKCARRTKEKFSFKGTIKTPGYPRPYSLRQICLWRIKVPNGYRVHLDFDDKFGVRCESMDRVTVSVRRLYKNVRPRVSSSSTVVLCGQSRISNVTAPKREMWVRFQAHRNDTKGVGFRATYTSLDINECEEKGSACQHSCTNTPGSYRCSCNRGFALADDGFNCSVIPYYKVTFENENYPVAISNFIPKYSKVMTVKAIVEGTSKQIKYSLIKSYPKPFQVKKYPFRISPYKGEITTRRHLPSDISEYEMTIKAEVNSKSYATAIISINVTRDWLDIKEIKFSSPHYSVIINDNLKRGDTVLRLSLATPEVEHHVVYNISTKTRYFTIDKDLGNLSIKQDLRELKLGRNLSKTFEFIVNAHLRERTTVATSVVISVIVIPAYAGDRYRHVEQPSGRGDDAYHRASMPPVFRRSEFAFHRFFRQLSPMARDISKAERKFTKVIHDLRSDVIGAYTDQRLRSTGTFISNLPTISLTSSFQLQDIIDDSHCVNPKADCSDKEFHRNYRTFDGTCNNLVHPLWGAANIPFNRIIKASYWDIERLGEPVGFPDQMFAPILPSPHTISKSYVFDKKYGDGSKTTFSHMMMQWGQFLDHDITFTAESEGSEICTVPRCDGTRADYESPCYPIMYPESEEECTRFTRSAAACQTDSKNIKPREQLNLITSYIDGSQIYGSSLEHSKSLRDYKVHPGYLALNSTQQLLPNLEDTLKPPLNLCNYSGGCFAAGDLRANEQIVLASMHTMWVREHNRLAAFLKHVNPSWHAEKVFQEARKIVIAELQHITYTEYLPKLLGEDAIPSYSGYDDTLDATIFNSFATSAFRAGHSMIRPGFSRLNAFYEPTGPDVPLVKAFFNNRLLHNEGIEPFILGLLANYSQTVDRGMAVGLTQHLFQQPGSKHGFNLAALNIQRGRDHGLPGYGSWRRECGLPQAFLFRDTRSEIKDRKTHNILKELYKSFALEHMDLWVAGLAEDPVPGAMVGPTFHCILKRQFLRLRDGDRFWYENPDVFTTEQLSEIKKMSLSKVVCDNLFGVVSAQKDAFVTATKESQRVECIFGFEAMNMNMSKWKDEKENKPVADSKGPFSEWINTTKTPTGSWASIDRVCENLTITEIECLTSDGKNPKSSGQTFTCNKDIGFYCRNIEQSGSGRICGDYKFRLRCSTTKLQEIEKKPEVTHFPSKPIENKMKCDPKYRYRYPSVIGLPLRVSKEITLFSPTKNNPGAEYLYLGRNKDGDQHRFLIEFDLRRVSRRSILLSATLQLLLVDVTHTAGDGEAAKKFSSALQVYPITSTDWHENNVTSVIPWNADYLGIDSDVDKNSVSTSASIQSKDNLKWLNINVFKSIYNWRISRKTRQNYGFMVKLANDEQAQPLLRFASNSHKNVAIRPQILVCLYIPPW